MAEEYCWAITQEVHVVANQVTVCGIRIIADFHLTDHVVTQCRHARVRVAQIQLALDLPKHNSRSSRGVSVLY